MGDRLIELGIKDVAMGGYGRLLDSGLRGASASRGLRVTLVDGRAAKSLSGRKSDVRSGLPVGSRDLHMHGLMNACVVPSADILVIRSYWRQRERLIAQRAEQILLMQKALEQMNVQIHKVLTDISGVSGMAIIRAIVGGERNPKVLSELLVAGAKGKERTH